MNAFTQYGNFVFNEYIGGDYAHETGSVPVFIKYTLSDELTATKTTIYKGLEYSKENVEFIREGIDGEKNHIFSVALVRHGHPGNCGYYPLALLFATKEKRRDGASNPNRTPPSQEWVAGKRKQVEDYYGLRSK